MKSCGPGPARHQRPGRRAPPRARLADGPVLTTGPFHRHEHQLTAYRVHELMTAEPVTARPDWPLAQAVLAMEQARINRLPVVDATGRPAS